jgi:hypothetical protein
MVINGVPSPAWMRFALDVAPHLIEFGAEPAPHLQRIRTPYLDLDLLWLEVL